jgi:hypothetical protein
MLTDLQNLVIEGLRAGNKLFEVLSAEGMPAKAVVEEWLLEDYFKTVYDRAVEVGKSKRQRRAEKGKPPRFHPKVVLAGSRPELPDELQEEAPSAAEPEVAELALAPPATPEPIAVPARPPAAKKATSYTDIVVQTVALDKLREGMPPAEVITSTRGMSSVKLAAWRKDPTFKTKWEHAKDEGRRAQKAQQERLTTEHQPAPEPVAPPPPVEAPAAAAPVSEVAPPPTGPNMSVACCARCGGEHVGLPITPFTNPVEYRGTVLATAFALCPANQQPILITVL